MCMAWWAGEDLISIGVIDLFCMFIESAIMLSGVMTKFIQLSTREWRYCPNRSISCACHRNLSDFRSSFQPRTARWGGTCRRSTSSVLWRVPTQSPCFSVYYLRIQWPTVSCLRTCCTLRFVFCFRSLFDLIYNNLLN